PRAAGLVPPGSGVVVMAQRQRKLGPALLQPEFANRNGRLIRERSMSLRAIVCVAVLAVAALRVPPAMAGDSTPQPPAKALDLKAGSDEFAAKKPSPAGDSDADAVGDLEATRSTIDRRSGPSVSIGVSGWVAGQVTGVR